MARGSASGVGVVVATYNVHRCVGLDGRHDPERVAEVIGELGADVIALQEVDSRAGVEGGIDQFELLARATGMWPIAGPTLRDHRGHYGNAILTSLPVVRTGRVDLSVPGREPRGALDVELDAGGRALRVIATHLGLAWRERRKQVARLVDLAGPAGRGPLVLLGDMNEWIPVGHSLDPLLRVFGRAPRKRTFPGFCPLLSLDRVWCRPADALEDVHVHATDLARGASDHLPLKVWLRLDGAVRTSRPSPDVVVG